jgi:chlorobactene glucosyltransferase
LPNLWLALQVLILVCLTAALAIALINQKELRRLGQFPVPEHWPRVSILVPARNEEGNIGPCLRSLLAQEYPDYEVLALDDSSRDRTATVLAALAAEHPRLRVLRGRSVPRGWMGKHWACQQLAEAAQGELLLFTDADTRHDPRALADGVAALAAQDADLVTGYPREEVVSWAERLAVPFFVGSFFFFLPVPLAHRPSASLLSMCVGQYMLFRRSAYEYLGGHAAVRQQVLDDVALGRLAKKRGLRLRMLDAGNRVRCRMYHNWQEIAAGFGKNLFGGFGGSLLGFLGTWLGVLTLVLAPLLNIALWAAGVASPLLGGLALAAVAQSIVLWGLFYRRFGYPLYLALAYPVSVLVWGLLALHALTLAIGGKATWKERPLERQRIRLW